MDGSVRLVEVLAALSLACDAADGFAAETTMRLAALAGLLARDVGDDDLVRDAIVGGLLRHIGCTGFAVEEARTFSDGDDVALRTVMGQVDFGQPVKAMRLIEDGLTAKGAAAIAEMGPAAGAAHDVAQCDAGERLAVLLPVTSAARQVATDAFERWDGQGGPAGKAGTEISLVARIVEVAYVAALFRSRQGRGGAVAELRLQSGGRLDPDLVARFVDGAAELFGAVDDPHRPVWELLLDLEPAPHCTVSPGEVDAAALAFARFTDLKSPWFSGHSEAVADLAQAVAGAGLRRAALLHDLGRVAVPTGTWELPRALRGPEIDRVRFHSWETHRILSATPLFAGDAQVAAAAHERVDGSGYHRGVSGPSLPREARVLAAADVATALLEARPHRPAVTLDAAVRVLRDEADAGRLDRSAVRDVCEALGARPARASWPAGLTEREVEVIRRVAAGSTNKDIARDLGITAKTVAHHVAHAYDKTGCRSRAGMALYVMEHGLACP